MEFWVNIFQTLAIILTLGLSGWQWKKNRETIKVDNYAKMISALNRLREERLTNPDLERALFKSRVNWSDDDIRKHVYGVMMANILEWSLFSHNSGLIDDKQWQDWSDVWKDVILADEAFATLMQDKRIYTFDYNAHELVEKWVKDREWNDCC